LATSKSPPAFANHLTAGATTIVVPATGAPLAGGNSNTPFRFSLPVGASCTADSAVGGYRIQSYLVPQSTNLDTMKFNSGGPTSVAGFKAPMYDTLSSSYVDQVTANATVPNGPGQIIQPLPAFDFNVYDTTGFPLTPGVYNVGIACTVGPPTSATQLDKYWNTVMTLTANAAEPGPAKVTWSAGAPATAPAAPVLNTVTPGNATLTANYTSTPSTPVAARPSRPTQPPRASRSSTTTAW